MPEARELRSVIEAAERAASDGDYVAAELNLREAAALQEAQLGPFHPELANTLNNLGVIYERADSPAEAEMCYRRAYAIATSAYETNHPFVATSRKNLEDFCRARGRPFERSSIPEKRTPPRKPARRLPSPIVLGVAGALSLAVLVAGVWWFRSSDPSASSLPDQTPTAAVRQPLSPSGPIDPEQKPEEATTEPNTPNSRGSIVHRSKSAAPESGSIARESRAPAPSPPAVVTIAEAHLCRRLSTRDWRCDQISSPVEPGPLFFYTRVNASNSTTVEHRWYHGDRLSQSVALRIQPSPGTGYRTYSRRTVTAASAGNWRVEVRTKDGSLLHEERFVVQ